MITGRDILYASEQRRDALALAERERLARKVLGRGLGEHRSFVSEHWRLWLAHLGAQLIRWGEILQARYARSSTSV